MATPYIAKPADRNSPYYYGADSTYKPKTKPAAPKKERPQYEIGLDGVPKVVTRKTPTSTSPNPTRPVQSTGGGVVNAFGKSFNMSVPAEKSAYEAAQAAELERQRKSSPFSDLRGDDGVKSDESRNSDPRRVTVTNANGVVQTGTVTGPKPMTMEDANSLLSPGYTMQNPFSSNQLPTTKDNPYENVGPVADGREYARMLESGKPGAVNGVGPIADGEQYAKNVEAGEQLSVKPSDTSGNSQNSGINWGARTAADNSDPNIARRRAFLDAESSLQGLRDTESLMGISYASGQHHMVNPNATPDGKNDFVSIGDKDDVRGYKSGRLSANDLKDKYVTKIKNNGITSYDESKVSETAGPLADADAYSPTLQNFRDNSNSGGSSQGNQKPLTVDLNDIPSDLSGAAGEEYLKRLDAGQLTRMR